MSRVAGSVVRSWNFFDTEVLMSKLYLRFTYPKETKKMSGATGVKFVLEASEEDRRAIKLVDLFMEYAAVSCVYRGTGAMTIRVRDLHQHFPHFLQRLNFPEGIPNAWYKVPDGINPAVALYERANADPRGRIIAYTVDYKPRELGKELIDLEIKAHSLGVSPNTRGINLQLSVNTVLEMMGSLELN